jgi:hypothetical protein
MVSVDMSESGDLRWFSLQNKVHEARICEAFALFRQYEIEPILIKGWAIARLYPQTHLRTYTDIDLGVSSSDFEKAKDLLEDEDAKKLNIDLHNEFRHLDTVEWNLLVRDSQLVSLHGTDIRILSPEDHLRILCVHWLTDSGADKERLFDIHYSVANRPEGFDWPKCLDRAGSTRRRWIVSAIGLAHRYTGLSLEGLPFAGEGKTIPAWLVKSLEKEWELAVPLKGLYDSLHDWRFFVKQLKKRIPPNAVFSTIDCEGEFDDRSRAPYQVRSFLRRALPAIRRILKTIGAGPGKREERT